MNNKNIMLAVAHVQQQGIQPIFVKRGVPWLFTENLKKGFINVFCMTNTDATLCASVFSSFLSRNFFLLPYFKGNDDRKRFLGMIDPIVKSAIDESITRKTYHENILGILEMIKLFEKNDTVPASYHALIDTHATDIINSFYSYSWSYTGDEKALLEHTRNFIQKVESFCEVIIHPSS